MTGKDFGASVPTVFIGEKRCIVTVKQLPATYHSEFACKVPEGSGMNLPVVVTAGVQSSSSIPDNNNVFSYDAPLVSSISPTSGLTSGLTETGERQQVTLKGQNFGKKNISEILITFEAVENGEEIVASFQVPKEDILSHKHDEVVFYQPEGMDPLALLKFLLQAKIA